MVDGGDYGYRVFVPLNRLSSHSKKPGGFGAWMFAWTGLTFCFGLGVGDGVAVGEGITGTVGVGVLVGIRVGILEGRRVGNGVLVGMITTGCCR